MVLGTLEYIIVFIVLIILVIVLLKFLFGVLMIAPIVYAAQEDAGSTTIETNETEIHVTCTENIEGLVADCG